MIRHSSLPKLDACPCFESAVGNSPAASRGTLIDGVIRARIAKQHDESVLREDESDAVEWGIQTIRELAGDHPLETREEYLKVATPGLEHIGTEDVRCEAILTSFDIKSGQIYDYRLQGAAYAYGNMERLFEAEWTYYFVFVDRKDVIKYHFTYEEAKSLVEGVLARVADPDKQPSACDYCRWCAKKNTCPQVVAPVEQTLAVVQSQASLDTLRAQLETPEKLGDFLRAAKVFDKELWSWAKDEAKTLLEQGSEVPGWRVSKSKDSEYFTTRAIAEVAQAAEATFAEVIDLFGGSVSGDALRKWAASRGVEVPVELAEFKPGVERLIEKKK